MDEILDLGRFRLGWWVWVLPMLLVVLKDFQSLFFRILLFVFVFFSDFEGGVKLGVDPKGTKHAISR